MTGTADTNLRVAVFGSGADLWQTVTLIQKQLYPKVDVILVEEEAEDSGAAAIRLDDPCFQKLDLEISTLLKAPSCHFSLGTELLNWQGSDSSQFLAGSGPLPDIDGFPIHQIMRHAASTYSNPQQLPYLYQPFQLAKRLVDAKKMSWASADPVSPLSLLRPVVHIKRTEFADILKSRCEPIQIFHKKPVKLNQSRDKKQIASVSMADGSEIQADFFIDLSGELSMLAGKKFDPEWKSLAGNMPFDRLAHLHPGSRASSGLSHSLATAIDSALLIENPLEQDINRQLLFADVHSGDLHIQEHIKGALTTRSIELGFCSNPWTQNVVRLGKPSAQLGPFLSADQMALGQAILILLDHFPAVHDMTVEAREFNRKFNIVIGQIVDFVIVPFHLNSRHDPFWRSMSDVPLPESAQIRLDQFRNRGLIVEFEKEQFDQQSWIDLFISFAVIPERTNPLLQSIDMQQIAKKLGNIAKAFDLTVAKASLREDFDRSTIG